MEQESQMLSDVDAVNGSVGASECAGTTACMHLATPAGRGVPGAAEAPPMP